MRTRGPYNLSMAGQVLINARLPDKWVLGARWPIPAPQGAYSAPLCSHPLIELTGSSAYATDPTPAIVLEDLNI